MTEPHIIIRNRELTDAQRIMDILDNENFRWFGRPPKTLEDQVEFMRRDDLNPLTRSYSIVYGFAVVGCIGVKMNPHRDWCAEIGYFVDETYWGRGIAAEAIRLVERECARQGIRRIVALVEAENSQSCRVLSKCGYRLEGVAHNAIISPRIGEFVDCLQYSKWLNS